MPVRVLGALASLELALHEWEPVPARVAAQLAALRTSLEEWPSGAALTVLAPTHGRWIRTAGGVLLDLRRRRALRRLVHALVEGRIERPGRPLSAGELIVAGWPDEQVDGTAAINRLYVALSRLRQLGLAEILLSASGGWLISPIVRVTRSETPEDEEQGEEDVSLAKRTSYVRELFVVSSPVASTGSR